MFDHEISRVLALTSTAPWNHASWGGSEAQRPLEIKTSHTVNPNIYPCACSITPILNHFHPSHHFHPASIFFLDAKTQVHQQNVFAPTPMHVFEQKTHTNMYIIMDWLQGQLTGNHDFTPKYWLVLCSFSLQPNLGTENPMIPCQVLKTHEPSQGAPVAERDRRRPANGAWMVCSLKFFTSYSYPSTNKLTIIN